MSDNEIVYFLLFAGFILLIVFIRCTSLRKLWMKKEIFQYHQCMYHRLNLESLEITTISTVDLEEEIRQLTNENYNIIVLAELNDFINKGTPLPGHSFLIAVSELYSEALQKCLTILIKEHLSLIIFLPVIMFKNNQRYHKEQAIQLNDFIFYGEFKNIFTYTQPKQQFQDTMLLSVCVKKGKA